MKKLIELFAETPALFFIIAALLWGGFLYKRFTPHFSDPAFQENLLVEATGLIFDLFVFGVVLSLYEGAQAKSERIKRFREEIDDFRHWDDKEAMYRILGCVRRLNREGVEDINLSSCHLNEAKLNFIKLNRADLQHTKLIKAQMMSIKLEKSNLDYADLNWADLSRAKLSGATLVGTNLSWADLRHADLSEANLREANLRGAEMEYANLERAILNAANLSETTFRNVNLKGAYLIGADLNKAILHNVDLDTARVEIDWFERLEKWQVNGWQKIMGDYLIDEKGILRLKSKQLTS